MFHKFSDSGKQGMTLLEVIIASAIFSAVMIVTLSVLDTSQKLQSKIFLRDNLRCQAELSLNAILEELQGVSEESISDPSLNIEPGATPPQQKTFMRFSKITGVDEDGVRSYTLPREFSIGWEAAPLEIPDNGKDDNQNGVIDEGMIVVRNYTDETDMVGTIEKVLAYNVKLWYDADNDISNGEEKPGFYMSFYPDNKDNPGKWLIEVSVVLEKAVGMKIEVDKTSMELKKTSIKTVAYYKTATIALQK